MSKKVKVIIILICVFCVCIFGYLYYNKPAYSKIVGEWENKDGSITGTEMAKDFGDSKAYEIGANINGKPIFKNHNKAFRKLKKDYKKGIKAIQKEFKLWMLTRFNWKMYGVYGCQLTTDDDELRKQGSIISQFFDIYENSFQK